MGRLRREVMGGVGMVALFKQTNDSRMLCGSSECTDVGLVTVPSICVEAMEDKEEEEGNSTDQKRAFMA